MKVFFLNLNKKNLNPSLGQGGSSRFTDDDKTYIMRLQLYIDMSFFRPTHFFINYRLN